MNNSMIGEYSLDNVYKTFNKVIDKLDNKSIYLYQFILAFRELSKFFDHLNIVFSFVAHDLTDKFNIIENLCNNNPKDYHTIQTMIQYEKSLNDKTGCIALLRLLRGLEFLYLFLNRAIVSPTGSLTSKQVAWNVYKDTLHKRHSRTVRMSIWCATATIPKREILQQTLLRGEIESNTADKCFPIIENVYHGIYKLYEDNNLLELVPV